MNSIQISKIFSQIQETSLVTQKFIDKFLNTLKTTASFIKKDAYFTPNATALMPDYRSYFDVIDENNKQITKQTIAKWQLLEQLATQREGQLFLFANEKYIQEIEFTLQENKINATIQAI